MITNRLLSVLVYAFVLLLVLLSVLSAFFLVLDRAQDVSAALAVRWAAGVILIALLVDVLLLVGALGVRAIEPPGSGEPNESGESE